MKQILYLLTSFLLLATSYAQLPPPLGPIACATGTSLQGDISINDLNGLLKQRLDRETDTINKDIAAASAQNGLKATIGYTIKNVFPAFLPTYNRERPNSNYIRIMYSVDYNITNISWKGISYFDRKLSQAITFSFYCNNWYDPQGGKSAFYTASEKPVLNEASIAEQAVNAILGGWLLDLVNRRISNALPTATSGQQGAFSNYKCSCLGLTPGTPPLREDGIVSFGFLAYATLANPPSVKVEIKSIKRLAGLAGETLPEWAKLQLEYYANYNKQTITADPMRIGDIVHPASSPLDATFPGRIGKLSIIINASSTSGPPEAYTTNLEFSKQAEFGKGTHTITLMRKKNLPPSRPGAQPPMALLIPAYEVTVEIFRNKQTTVTGPAGLN